MARGAPPCIFYVLNTKGSLKLLEIWPINGCLLDLDVQFTTRRAEPSVTVVLSACPAEKALTLVCSLFLSASDPGRKEEGRGGI